MASLISTNEQTADESASGGTLSLESLNPAGVPVGSVCTVASNEAIVLTSTTTCSSSLDLHSCTEPIFDIRIELNQNPQICTETNDGSDFTAISSPEGNFLGSIHKVDSESGKKSDSFESEQSNCLQQSDQFPSCANVGLLIGSASKRKRKRISGMQTDSLCRVEGMAVEAKTVDMEMSLSDSKLEEKLLVPNCSEETPSEPEPPKMVFKMAEINLSPFKKIRNPYGRKGKPANMNSAVDKKKKKVNSSYKISRTRVKVDHSKPGWVNPEWLKPFQEGWRREVVYRNAGVSSTSGRKCDIYYFTPDDQKLRSTPEIGAYLSNSASDLTTLSFTFVKHPIYQEPGEFVRNAATSGKRGGLSVMQSELPKAGKKTKLLLEKKKPSIKLKLKCTNIQTRDEKLFDKNVSGNFLDGIKTDADLPEPSVSRYGAEDEINENMVGDNLLPMDIDTDLSKSMHTSSSAAITFSVPSLSLIKNSKTLKWKPKKPKQLKKRLKLKRLGSRSLLKSTPVFTDIGKENSDAFSSTLAKEDLRNVSTVSKVVNNQIAREIEVSYENMDLAEVELEKSSSAGLRNVLDPSTEEEISKLSPILPLPADLKDANGLDDQRTLKIKAFSGRHVARKSTASKGRLPSQSKIRVRMSYKEGLPNKNITGKKNGFSGFESDGNSVSCASFYPGSDARPCGLHCAGLFGMAPSLHCDICMCLFHPECVGVGHVPHRTSFTCKACCNVNGDNNDDMEDALESSFASSHSSGGKNTAALNDIWLKSNMSAQSFFSQDAFSSFSDQNSVAEKSSERGVDGANVVSLNGVNNDEPSGRVLTLPLSMVSLLDLSKPFKLALNGRKYTIPTNCHLLTAYGLRVFLPHDIFSAPSRQGPVTTSNTSFSPRQTDVNFGQVVSVPSERNSSNFKANNSCKMPLFDSSNDLVNKPGVCVSDHPVLNDVNHGKLELAESCEKIGHEDEIQTEECRPSGKMCVEDACTELVGHDLENIPIIADILLRIFKFLNLVNLLKVSKVCTLWKQVSETPLLWKKVTFDGVAVLDWELAAHHFTKNGTTHLDLSGLIHSGSMNQTWHQLSAIFSNLATIRHLVFGPCPPNLLYCVASKITGLESLIATQITDVFSDAQTSSSKRLTNTKLDIGKVAVLKNLVKLELRGLHGLILPSHSFTSDLSELGHMSELKYLSVTSLRDVTDDQFDFFSYLKKLEVLEIGDCKLWTRKTYEQLGHLKYLQKLKLENGVESADDGLGTVLLSLNQLEHLELSCFVMSEHSAVLLATMSHFKRLSLSLEAVEKASYSNSYLLTSIQGMTFLEQLSWNVITSDANSSTVIPVNCKLSSCSHEEKFLPFSSTRDVSEHNMNVELGRQQDIEWKSLTEIEAVLKKSLTSTSIHFTHS